ncbi:MAG TPA: GNAT family N-acetyltransferase [Spirochaetota bacterium]|nr:GNAT family N-acetyltransferase [Spirochaetota bacterium]
MSRKMVSDHHKIIDALERSHPEKFLPADAAFARIKRGSRIFMGTGCGQPRFLLNALIDYAEANPKALFDAEMYVLLAFGMEQYRYERFERSFHQHCFTFRDNTRRTLNRGSGDYNPVFLSNIPRFIKRRIIPIDVAFVQVSLPDVRGRVSLGISVDITRSAVDAAGLVIAQMNAHMPFVHGDAVLPIEAFDVIIPHDEPLLEIEPFERDDTIDAIGAFVSGLVEDGSTLSVGHGRTAQGIIPHLAGKKNLGIHSELISDNLVGLIRAGAVDNAHRSIHPGVSTGTICMGSAETYRFLHDNRSIELKTADYVNNPAVIANNRAMVSINGVLSVDCTGQATAESIGASFYSGLGGTSDFARGASLSDDGKSILVLRSSAQGGAVSRIVPFLKEGEGITVNRGDAAYVVTEYGVAHLAGKNIRNRALELIGIAHPAHRAWLIEQAKRHNLIHRDQVFIPGKSGEYPVHLEETVSLDERCELLIRPVKLSDERLLKEFFYSLSPQSLYNRFVTVQKEMPHEVLQTLVAIDYRQQMTLLAIDRTDERETVLGIAQYIVEDPHFANFSISILDDWQNRGIGSILLDRCVAIARQLGISGFTVDVLTENKAMIGLVRHARKRGHSVDRTIEGDMVLYVMTFCDAP